MKTIFEDNLVSLTDTYTAFSDKTSFRNRPILLSQATVHFGLWQNVEKTCVKAQI